MGAIELSVHEGRAWGHSPWLIFQDLDPRDGGVILWSFLRRLQDTTCLLSLLPSLGRKMYALRSEKVESEKYWGFLSNMFCIPCFFPRVKRCMFLIRKRGSIAYKVVPLLTPLSLLQYDCLLWREDFDSWGPSLHVAWKRRQSRYQTYPFPHLSSPHANSTYVYGSVTSYLPHVECQEPKWSVKSLISPACYFVYIFDQKRAQDPTKQGPRLLNESSAGASNAVMTQWLEFLGSSRNRYCRTLQREVKIQPPKKESRP